MAKEFQKEVDVELTRENAEDKESADGV